MILTIYFGYALIQAIIIFGVARGFDDPGVEDSLFLFFFIVAAPVLTIAIVLFGLLKAIETIIRRFA